MKESDPSKDVDSFSRFDQSTAVNYKFVCFYLLLTVKFFLLKIHRRESPVSVTINLSFIFVPVRTLCRLLFTTSVRIVKVGSPTVIR